MIEERPVFRPKNFRPARDEQWELKQAVIARDGLTTCFWCRKPFANEEDATLEHIYPLADGGVHDLRNSTLACYQCNLRNVPRGLVDHIELVQQTKEAKNAANRAANGWKEPEDCDEAGNETIRRHRPQLPIQDAQIRRRLIHPEKHSQANGPTASERSREKGFQITLQPLAKHRMSDTMKSHPSPTPPRPMDVTGIMPVLRKLAKIGCCWYYSDHTDKLGMIDFHDGKISRHLTLGDCRKVKRWVEKMEKMK